ncbi:MAG: hypothetical protein ACOYMD_05320 [Paludibacter sp.]
MKKLSICFFISIMLCSCSIFENRVLAFLPEPTLKQNADWKNRCGKWYSKSITKENETREEICDSYEDGTFILKTKTMDKEGNITIHIESGEWGISGNIYFTIIKAITENAVQGEVDVLSPFYRDAYKIKSLSDKKMVYQHINTKDIYVDIKVDKNFELK